MCPTVFDVRPEISAVLVEARSTVGRIEIATTSVSGTMAVRITEAGLSEDGAAAMVELEVASLTSGTALYDAEVRRRLEARRYPTIRAELRAAQPLPNDRWEITGELTIHGTTRTLSGTAEVVLADPDTLTVSGEQVIDIRDFDIEVPSVLMLRIYPDVTVRYRIAAVRVEQSIDAGAA